MAAGSSSLRQDLLDKLDTMHTRAIDLFHSWDEDKSGSICKPEFRKALKALGFTETSNDDIDGVFDLLDSNKTGEIHYEHLVKLVKDANSMKWSQPKQLSRRPSRDTDEEVRVAVEKTKAECAEELERALALAKEECLRARAQDKAEHDAEREASLARQAEEFRRREEEAATLGIF